MWERVSECVCVRVSMCVSETECLWESELVSVGDRENDEEG